MKLKIFSAVWCANCKTLKKQLTDAGIAFEEVDADTNMQTLRELNVRGLPATLIDFDDNTKQVIQGSDLKKILAAINK